MNILFLTLVSFSSLQERNIYSDLLREFVKNGHQAYVISPVERRQGKTTHMIKENNTMILRLQIGNTQKTNIIEKGISTIMIEPVFKHAIKRYFSDIKFDLVLYSTPPITLVGAIEYIKKRDGAKSYLLLKDIFPQNAVDIGLISTVGVKGVLYKHFREQEKRLYAISDGIGCMSPANVQYIISHNPTVDSSIVEVCPNSIEVIDKSVDEKMRTKIRQKYNIPMDKKVFVYGGNLGKPQGISFLIKCLKKCVDIKEVFFLIIGSGTEYHLVQDYVERVKPGNVGLMKGLPKEDYDNMVGACDVGLIFLDHRFTIPNFPSRILTYMQAKLPVLAATDPNTDVGEVIVDGGFGWWCESIDEEEFKKCINNIVRADIQKAGRRGFDFLNKNFSVKNTYNTIFKSIKKEYRIYE